MSLVMSKTSHTCGEQSLTWPGSRSTTLVASSLWHDQAHDLPHLWWAVFDMIRLTIYRTCGKQSLTCVSLVMSKTARHKCGRSWAWSCQRLFATSVVDHEPDHVKDCSPQVWSYISMRWWQCPLCTRPTLSWILIMLVHWNNSPFKHIILIRSQPAITL
jgi:hypothetical protein